VPVLYVTGEESAHQVKLRASRIPAQNPALYLLAETNLEAILVQADALQPTLLIVDSVQTLFLDGIDSAPGSVSQVRECTAHLMRLAKETGTSVILVGHVNKEGMIAGPKVLEHMVDVVLEFEGERNFNYRILRSTKNRFGATPELGIYDMRLEGLREVTNPSELFLSEHDSDLSGIATAATLQAQRPLLVETQALVSDAAYGNAQRSATGLDLRRLNMLLAVLEKKGGFKLGAKDVFVNLAGGIRIDDPALDLALAAAIVSSAYDIAIPPKTAFAAEIGLTGEIRGVSRIDARIAEARRMGFARIFISARQRDYAPPKPGSGDLEVILCGQLQEAFAQLFG
jgi:DNA repair protein RadA/Sms